MTSRVLPVIVLSVLLLACLASAAPRVRTAYFVRGEDVPASLSYDYDVVFVPWRSLIDAEAASVDSCIALQAAGHEVYVHVAIAYLNFSGGNAIYDSLLTIVGDTTNGAGWMRTAPDGYLQGTAVWKLIDPRPKAIRDSLIAAHISFFDNAAWTPDGVMLDFVWDEIYWRVNQTCVVQACIDSFNLTYKTAIYALAEGFKAGVSGAIYGNGWHSCTALDGTCHEDFPETKEDDVMGGADNRGTDVALWGDYGKTNWELFRNPPILVPMDWVDQVGYGVPAEIIVEAVAFASAYCPNAIVIDNEGNVFQAIADLEAITKSSTLGRRR